MINGAMNLLAIDTATDALSLAVARGQAVREVSIRAGQRHAELVIGEIDRLLADAGLRVADLDAIVYGAGPGSFTGLRIACGVAQGIAAARAVPVLGIGTLEAIAEASGAPRVVACLDARMGEVYHAAFHRSSGVLQQAIPPGLHRPDAVPLPAGGDWIGAGAGWSAYGEALRARHGEAVVAVRPEVLPSAAAMLRLATPRLLRGEGVDAAQALPVYLRDRVALKTAER
jgi:tRNA threonylcarbamoyladenosine biosynthesis protein TsaB